MGGCLAVGVRKVKVIRYIEKEPVSAVRQEL